MPLNTAHVLENRGRNPNIEVALPPVLITGVAAMFFAVILDLQKHWRKGVLQFLANFVFDTHFFAFALFNLPDETVNSLIRVGKAGGR